MRTANLFFALVALALVSAGKAKLVEAPATDVGRTLLILGDLGLPIGEMVTIRGEKVHAAKGDEINFFVDTVNGEPLKRRTTVRIKGIVDWPLGTKAEIRGQEVGTVTFTDIRKTGMEENSRFAPRQTLWLEFVAEDVLSPRDLSLKRRSR